MQVRQNLKASQQIPPTLQNNTLMQQFLSPPRPQANSQQILRPPPPNQQQQQYVNQTRSLIQQRPTAHPQQQVQQQQIYNSGQQQQRIVQQQAISPMVTPQRQVIQQVITQQPSIDQNELVLHLEDLQRRYDKMAMELQVATQRQQFSQNKENDNLGSLTAKLIQMQSERDRLEIDGKAKDEKIRHLSRQLEVLQSQYGNELSQIRSESDRLSQTLTDKLDQMNSLFREKMLELEQYKSLLALREQEVQEWRSRRQYNFNTVQVQQDSSNEVNMLRAQLEEKEQELKTLRIKYEYKQKSLPSGDDDLESKIHILQNEINRQNQTIISLKQMLHETGSKAQDAEFYKSKVMQQHQEIQQIKASGAHGQNYTPELTNRDEYIVRLYDH